MALRTLGAVSGLLWLASAPAAGGLDLFSKAAAPSNAGPVFRRDVHPLLDRLGCGTVECHGAFAGQGGMTLVLFGGDPVADYETLVKAERGQRVNRMEPEKSLLLLKTTGAAHGCKQPVKPGSPEYKLLLSWIQNGAPYDDNAPALVSLALAPAEQTLAKGKSARLTVTATYGDGSRKDVTKQATFRAREEGVAGVGADGTVKAAGFGLGTVVARYLGEAAVARVLVPQPVPGGVPKPAPANRIDELVFAHLEKLGLPPSEMCGDEVFLRRVYLDVAGGLPPVEEARAFLADAAPDKRARLIDRLLDSDGYAVFGALRWADILRIKSEDPVSLWPKGAEAYYQWVYESLASNKPYDQFARELLTATGSDFRNGAVNFFRAVPKRDPQSYGEAAALVFLGARLACARCHGHPEEGWGREDNLRMAAFFSQVRYKWTSEWKEEILFRDSEARFVHPRTGAPVVPAVLDGNACGAGPGADLRKAFAEMVAAPGDGATPFGRAIANRVWFWLTGRGIVHEPDDMRPTNPPSNPALLDYLAAELVSHGYDLKHLHRLILNSRTYQLASAPHPLSANDTVHFSHRIPRKLAAEQLLDALAGVTGVARGSFGTFHRPTLAPVTSMPEDTPAIAVSDGSAECSAATMLGRPNRATGFEAERAAGVRQDHIAFLAGSKEVENAINNSARLRDLQKSGKPDGDILDEIFLAALSRPATAAEKEKLSAPLAAPGANRGTVLQNVMWAVLNTTEFLMIP